MSSLRLFACLALMTVVATVSGERCPDALATAQANCGGLGCFTPACEGDNFAAVQCFGSVCYCVKADDGTEIGYNHNIGTTTDGACLCAREKGTGCADDGSYPA